MAIVNVNPRDEKRPMLEQAGQYGPGLQYPADVELTRFDSPNAEGLLDFMPAYDREGNDGPYWHLNIKVTLTNGRVVFVRNWQRSRQLRKTLDVMGIPVTDNPDGTYSFDDAQVAPRKLGGVDVKAPREAPDGRQFAGEVKAIIGG